MKTQFRAVLVASALFTTGSAALAADAIIFQEPVPMTAAPSALHNWTGFYVGAFGGLAQGEMNFSTDFEDGSGSIFDNSRSISGSNNAGGFLGGAQIGYDVQINNFVIGAFADIAATNLEAEARTFDTFNGDASTELSYQLDYLGTVQGRVGYAMDRLLVYGRGGFAYGDVTFRSSTSGTGFGGPFETSETFETSSKQGYTIGAGAEFAITERITFQADYAYTDLGSDDFSVSDEFAGGFSNGFGDADDVSGSESFDFHTIKMGVNFRF